MRRVQAVKVGDADQESQPPVGRLRARAYIRVSHIGKSRQASLLSDSMQLDEARRYAEYMGFCFQEEASRTNADLDVSGFRKPWRDRPGLMNHYRAAENGELDVLIFYKISRLARNVREALDMIAAFEKLGVAFHFVAERIDSTSGPGRFVRNVLLSAAEMQSEDISEFLKSACERRAREGRLQGGGVPAWIRRTDEGRFELDSEQAKAFQRMVELRLDGLGYVRIAQALNCEGFRTCRGRYWTHGATYKYLQPTWIETMKGTGFFGRNAAEPIEIPNAFPAILGPEKAEQLLAIQKLYSEDYGRKPVGGLDWMVSKRRKRGRYSASSIHLLSSIVFCPFCGARMVASMRSDSDKRATPFKYGCPNYRTRPNLHQRGMSSVSAEGLEDAVLRVIRGVLLMPPAERNSNRPIPAAKDSLRSAQERIDRLVAMHLDGKIQEDDYRRIYTELILEKEQAQSLKVETSSVQLHKALQLSSKDKLSREELRQLVLLLVERVDAPVTMADCPVREGLGTLRRLARVKLKFPVCDGKELFLSPIHKADFSGERRFWALA